LAYGAKGIQWFLGSTDPSVVAINSELNFLGPTLVRLRSVNVFHTSDVPKEGLILPADHWYGTTAEDTLIGEFASDESSPVTYFVVANKSIDHVLDIPLKIRRGVIRSVAEVSKTSTARIATPFNTSGSIATINIELAPGDGRVFRIEFASNDERHKTRGE
jgi:hypothetical protein